MATTVSKVIAHFKEEEKHIREIIDSPNPGEEEGVHADPEHVAKTIVYLLVKEHSDGDESKPIVTHDILPYIPEKTFRFLSEKSLLYLQDQVIAPLATMRALEAFNKAVGAEE